ncbi:MAG: nicotinate-nucleotide adenylyltransferase [Caldisericaceae bacterium]|nr:nicotinate-nucleotide adenylyltransferase [Caldisericaceae bacterium]
MKKTNKIGLFGGAFNPIHNGHLFVAKESIKTFNLNKIIFIPTGNPVFEKQELLNKQIRANFVKNAISNEKNFEVSFFEIEREAPSFFIDTLQHFNNGKDMLFTILGEDTFMQFHKWKSPEEILENSYLIVAKRYEGNFVRTKKYIKKYFTEYKEKILFLSHPLFSISSTLIRERIKKEKHISYLLPESIEKKIVENGYYR